MSDEVTDIKNEYKRMVYDRDYVTNSDILDLLSEVLGIPRANLEKVVCDLKVTPVVVVNDYNYDNYELVASFNLGLGLGADIHFCSVDNEGNTYFYVHGDNVLTRDKEGNALSSYSALCQDFALGLGMVNGRHFFARDAAVPSFMQHWYKGVLKTRIDTGLVTVSPWACSPSGKYFVGCEAGDDDVELWMGSVG